MLCKCHHTAQGVAASPDIWYKWVSFVILRLQMLPGVDLDWSWELLVGKLQTAQCPLLVNSWPRRHSRWSVDVIWIYKHGHTQVSTQDISSYFTHICIHKPDLHFNRLYSQGFEGFFFKLESLICCVHSILMRYDIGYKLLCHLQLACPTEITPLPGSMLVLANTKMKQAFQNV